MRQTNLNFGFLSLQSTITIYESQYKCTINPNEFTYTQNPTALINRTDGVAYDFLTGSYFQPYVTTVGLYNNANEMLAVAKTSQPIAKSFDKEILVKVKLDF